MSHALGYRTPASDGRRLGKSLRLAAGMVVAVVGFCLLAAAAVVFLHKRAEARVAFANTGVASLSTSLESFEVDTGRYPTAAEGLAALVSRPAGTPGWHGPYLPAVKPDPWGRPYVYHPGGPGNGPAYRVLSMGPDGKEGTGDDVLAGSVTLPAVITTPASRPSGAGP